MKLDIWTKAKAPPKMGHNPPPSKEERMFILMMNDIFKRQVADAVKNVKKVLHGDRVELVDRSRWIPEIAELTEGLRFVPFKRGGDEAIADLYKVRKQFGLTEWIEDPTVLRAVKEESFMFARTISDKTANDLQVAMMKGVKAGESITQIERRVVAVNEAWRDSKRSMMIARTETSRAYTQGQVAAWEQTGVVTEKVWSAASDSCPFCAAMNGKVVGLKEDYLHNGDVLSVGAGEGRTASMRMGYGNVNGPPLHPNCRCSIVAHVVAGRDVGEPVGTEFIKPGRGPKPTGAVIESTQISSVGEAKTLFEKNLGFTKNIQLNIQHGYQVDMLKDLASVGSELTRVSKYKGMKRMWGKVKINNLKFTNAKNIKGISPGGVHASAAGAYDGKSKTMWLSSGTGTKAAHKVDKGTFICGGDAGSIARHELGHRTFGILPSKATGKWIDKASFDLNPINFKKDVSKYAGKNMSEGFAESFSAYTSPLYKRGSLPSWVEKFMDTYIGG